MDIPRGINCEINIVDGDVVDVNIDTIVGDCGGLMPEADHERSGVVLSGLPFNNHHIACTFDQCSLLEGTEQ